MSLSIVLPWLLVFLVSVLFLALAYLAFWKFWFLRDPERDIPPGDSIVSPADGKIVAIVPFDIRRGEIATIPKAFFGRITSLLSEIGEEGVIVSVFMSPLNVHVNRSPIDGVIVRQEHTSGRFRPAYDFPASLIENEKNEMVIKGNVFSIKVIQIAGALARRIESFVAAGDTVKRGQRIGRINLGSQCSLILPKGFSILVRPGEKVFAGSTVIATVDPAS